MEDEEQTIRRRADGYYNVLDLCQNAGALFADYMDNENVKDFMAALAAEKGLLENSLVSRQYDYNHAIENAIWVHPCVAIHFSCCCSPAYFTQVVSAVEQFQEMPTPAKLQLGQLPYAAERSVGCVLL